MTVNRGIFVRATGTSPNKVGTTPVESRLAIAGLVAENSGGVPRQGILAPAHGLPVVAADTGANVYHVQPFQAVISRATNEGVYILSASGVTQVATDPAPGTGSRWDIIYVKQNDVDKGDANNLPVLDVVKGTAATSPVRPTVPTGGMALAEARIYSGSGSTGGGTNTLTQLHTYTAARGGAIPIRDVADRTTLSSPTIGQRIIRLDRDNHEQTYKGPNPVTQAAMWEWTSVPERYYSDTMGWDSTASAATKLIGEVFDQGARTYARKMRVNGRLHVSCAAIGAGILAISANVSINQTAAGTAQDKARMSFVPPGGYWQTASVETPWISVAAGQTGLPRIWLEHISGSVNTSSAATSVYGHLWVECLPEDD